MDSREFMNALLASYPAGLRPDADYQNTLIKEINKRPCSSPVYLQALSNIQGSFRMFPTLPDLKWAFNEALKSVASSIAQSGMEYFDIGKHTFVRPVGITADGEVLRKDLPEGATNYQLVLPPKLQAKTDAITAEEAYNQGCISEELYQMVKSRNEKQPFKGRFQKIGELIKDKQPELPITEAEYEVVDDSMAANPEEPAHDDYEDI